MAKKEETISLIDTFSEFKELKNIDRTTMVSVLEESFRSVIAKMFGTDENYDVIVNPDKGDFEIWRNREVVADEDLTNPNMQISLTEAQKIDASYEVGEEVTDEVIFAKFGRRAILNLRQTLASKILELEKDSLYNKYIDRVGTVISAEVYQIWKKEMLLLDDEGNELLLPKTEQIPSDFYRKGETARAVVARVDNKNNNPKIILSRTSPVFLQRLFEMEVPEINDGLITIKKIARIPGERAKIAVESYDDRIDPVGACVGVKGSRIHGIVRELRNENLYFMWEMANTTYITSPSDNFAASNEARPWRNSIPMYIALSIDPSKQATGKAVGTNKDGSVYTNPFVWGCDGGVAKDGGVGFTTHIDTLVAFDSNNSNGGASIFKADVQDTDGTYLFDYDTRVPIGVTSYQAQDNRNGFKIKYANGTKRSEERRVGKECRSRWSPDH